MTDQTHTHHQTRRQIEPGSRRPVEPGKPDPLAAFKILSGMENRLATVLDLGWAVVMCAQSETGMEEQYASSLVRLGMLIIEKAHDAEAERGEASMQLHALAYPKAVQS